MNRSGKLHALLATSRIANVPSVVSNVWLGVAIGITITAHGVEAIPWAHVFVLAKAGICLYVAGNFLNDWMDRGWDACHRPERALPRGLFPARLYRDTAIALAGAAVGLSMWVNWLAGMVALGILANIVVYTVWHKRGAWTVIPMGLCRGLLPMLGAVGMIQMPAHLEDMISVAPVAGLLGGGLFFYIAGLSLSARRESKESPSSNERSLPWWFFALTACFMLSPFIFSNGMPWLFVVAPIPYLLWLVACRTIFLRPISRYVSALLAGIPLVDWIVMLPFALTAGFFRSTAGFSNHPLEIISLALPPLAFILALALQRLAPAT